ncbi:MAG: DNA polymerase III subunit delta [Peptoniphilaceae bacterium]|nr:DNA polymerase III subunit delta [Peptoniphilaceae bacterium]MDD7383778.1 DNA polymerase III subunit delta [Peptoniphilaceae bacterium]MDY3738106.1 DNA polymerase III subunit delta [Peptoniphilaceae bacterium]
MNYIDVIEKLSEKNLSGIFLCEYEEAYLKDNIIDNIKKELTVPDFNFINFKNYINYEDLKTSIDTYPIIDEKKYIIWQNVDFSKNMINQYEDVLNPLMNDFKNFPNYSTLFIFTDKPIFKGKFYKSILKNQNIVNISKLNYKQLVNFIGKRFSKNNKKITLKLIDIIINSLAYFSDESNTDLYSVINSVDKIISNSHNEIVNIEDINSQLENITDANIFQLTDFLSQKNITDALSTFEFIYNQGEDLFKVFFMIVRHIRNLIGIKTLINYNFSDDYIRNLLKISNFELKKDKTYIKNFKLSELIKLYNTSFEIDISSKSLKFNMKVALEFFISKW